MVKIENKKLSDKKISNYINSINKDGYCIIRNFFSKKTIKKFLLLVKKDADRQKNYHHLSLWLAKNYIYPHED